MVNGPQRRLRPAIPTPPSPGVGPSPERPQRRKDPKAESVLAGSTVANTPNLDDAGSVGESVRMLEDSKGHLCKWSILLYCGLELKIGSQVYIGDSATLSYLDTIRDLVETTLGQSRFTMDPQKHKILEGSIFTPAQSRHTNILPDREAADFLIDSYFSNVRYFEQIVIPRLISSLDDRHHPDS